jgi:hypothetical protein
VKCPHCPVPGGNCLGERAARLCELAATRPDYRRLLVDRAREVAATGEQPPSLDAMLAAVSACRHRGRTLPHSIQAECGCGELTECRSGRGKVTGRVTLRDCLACISAGEPAGTTADAPTPG